MDNHNHNDPSIIKVSNDTWQIAQQQEGYNWVFLNRRNGYLRLLKKFLRALKNPKQLMLYFKFRDFYCGDDWNYWWLNAFENYKTLPKSFGKALEVGSGPYSNIRLISQITDIKEIYCTDPLMFTYLGMRMTWVAEMVRKNKIKAFTGKAEKIDFPDNFFELVVCNNVLDHVEDAGLCFKEMLRVLKPGGYFVFGQDLSDEHDLENPNWKHDHVHPIKLHHSYIDSILLPVFEPKLHKITTREEGRHPEQNYGNYIFIGQKKV
jgi:SAM-dependent methyltransferase